MSITNVSGGAGVSEVGVDTRVDARIGKPDACAHDPVFESFGFMVPLAAPIRDTPLHCQDAVIFVHEGSTSLCFLS
jgi:hypothetical protein